jgi:flagellar motor switch/type III secretory pathway protein FliN
MRGRSGGQKWGAPDDPPLSPHLIPVSCLPLRPVPGCLPRVGGFRHLAILQRCFQAHREFLISAIELHGNSRELRLAPMMIPPSQPALPGISASNPGTQKQQTNEPDPADLLPWLPCTVSLEIPLRRFTIGDLSTLSKGSVVTTACPRNSYVPLYVNGQMIAWTELEVIDDRLAVRITEIA